MLIIYFFLILINIFNKFWQEIIFYLIKIYINDFQIMIYFDFAFQSQKIINKFFLNRLT